MTTASRRPAWRARLLRGAYNDIALGLVPGEYALFCIVPDAKDGKPHVMHGMQQQIAVE